MNYIYIYIYNQVQVYMWVWGVSVFSWVGCKSLPSLFSYKRENIFQIRLYPIMFCRYPLRHVILFYFKKISHKNDDIFV